MNMSGFVSRLEAQTAMDNGYGGQRGRGCRWLGSNGHGESESDAEAWPSMSWR